MRLVAGGRWGRGRRGGGGGASARSSALRTAAAPASECASGCARPATTAAGLRCPAASAAAASPLALLVGQRGWPAEVERQLGPGAGRVHVLSAGAVDRVKRKSSSDTAAAPRRLSRRRHRLPLLHARSVDRAVGPSRPCPARGCRSRRLRRWPAALAAPAPSMTDSFLPISPPHVGVPVAVEPNGILESMTCRQRSRSRPIRDRLRRAGVDALRGGDVDPDAKQWQVSRQMPNCSGRASSSMISASPRW